MNDKITAYKGFDKDMKCRGFQYEIGKEYEQDGEIMACKNGFHACEQPLDVFDYYRPGSGARYCVVEQSGDLSSDGEDSKVASRKIKIGAEIGIPGLIKAHFEYVKNLIAKSQNKENGGNGANLAGGNGANLAGGNRANLAGGNGANLAGGNRANLAGGDWANLAGGNGANLAGGDGANLAGGDWANLAGGNGANLAGGNRANLAGGNGANLASRGSCSVGKNGNATVRGNNVKARGGIGSVLTIIIENDYNYDVKEWKSVFVDGEIVKADTWYTLKDGELVEI